MVYYDGNVLTNQIVYGVIGNYLVGLAKRSPWLPFLNAATPYLNRAVTIGIALVSALGLEYTYSYTPEGMFTLTLAGLTFWSVFEHGKQFLVAYIFQQIPYHAMKFRDATAMASTTDRRGTTQTVVASTSSQPVSDHKAEMAEKNTP